MKVRWADGTYVEIPENIVGLSLLVKVAPDRFGHLTGLLGDAGAPAATRFLGREGKPYAPTTLEQSEKNVYHPYGASWRISQRESLFTYPRHKNTHSYTILDFPKKLFNEGTRPAGQGAAHRSPLPGRRGPPTWRYCRTANTTCSSSGKPGYAAGDALVQANSEPGPTPRARTTTPGPVGVVAPRRRRHSQPEHAVAATGDRSRGGRRAAVGRL